MFDETTDPGSLRVELRHIRERCDEWNERQDVRLNDHSSRLGALERALERFRGAWWAVSIAAACAAAGGSFLASWIRP